MDILKDFPNCKAYIKAILFFESLKQSDTIEDGFAAYQQSNITKDRILQLLNIDSLERLNEIEHRFKKA